jgi:hypothetical protein
VQVLVHPKIAKAPESILEDLPRNDGGNDPGPSIGSISDAKSDEKRKEYADGAGRHVHESRILRSIAQVLDERG